jgi:hypothetical protein
MAVNFHAELQEIFQEALALKQPSIIDIKKLFSKYNIAPGPKTVKDMLKEVKAKLGDTSPIQFNPAPANFGGANTISGSVFEVFKRNILKRTYNTRSFLLERLENQSHVLTQDQRDRLVRLWEKRMKPETTSPALPKFFYHGTGQGSFEGVQKEGLKAPAYFAPNPKVAVTQALESAYAGSMPESARHNVLANLDLIVNDQRTRDAMRQGEIVGGKDYIELIPPQKNRQQSILKMVPPKEQPILLRVRHAALPDKRETGATLKQISQAQPPRSVSKGIAFEWPYESVQRHNAIEPKDLEVFGRTKGGAKRWVNVARLLKNPKLLAKFGLPAVALALILRKLNQGGQDETENAGA